MRKHGNTLTQRQWGGVASRAGEPTADVFLYRTGKSLPYLDVDPRMQLAKCHERGRQNVMRDGHEAGDDDLATQLTVEVPHFFATAEGVSQETLRHRYELAAGLGLRDASGPTLEQFHAQ